MLTIGTKPGQYVVINDNIKVYVIRQKNEIRIAIDAPREIPIIRGELYEQNQQAQGGQLNIKEQSPTTTV